ncbi:MAG: MNIO family bufferin maturase [Silanimonas sp.]
MIGIGFKPMHAARLLGDGVDLDFVEVHAENLMGAGGPVHAQLDAVRAAFSLSVHGVGLSIGGEGPLDDGHLERLARVVARFEPAAVSEHLAWSTHGGVFFNDLLPIAYDAATLERVVRHVQQVQERLQRRVLIENPSTYVALAGSAMEEADFLAELVARSGCGLLLDINNVVVSQHNRGESPGRYVDRYPLQAVGEIHLAGHAVEVLDDDTVLRIDDHGSPVGDEVWALYAQVVERLGAVPTLIEWDTDVPAFDALAGEAYAARRIQHRHLVRAA